MRTRVTAKSVSGFGGSFRGHCTVPGLRRESGGIETATSVIDSVGLRSPENNVAASPEGSRVVATSMSTCEVADGCARATGAITPFAWPPQPARRTRATSADTVVLPVFATRSLPPHEFTLPTNATPHKLGDAAAPPLISTDRPPALANSRTERTHTNPRFA
ncbi:hypothetical protein EMEDMD4_490081 [Sinorhizobium medicae]|uniref:Uncharacterized protein n=1 Tax=Sinorhizobium medicae TaxID=110321 RepID=A0A508X093_9HYPH|nr:hypothetical protein EMEDMD4_490081 [Sinorhizobium medicae]